MRANLGLAFFPMKLTRGELEERERELIELTCPILNLSKHVTYVHADTLRAARRTCADLARKAAGRTTRRAVAGVAAGRTGRRGVRRAPAAMTLHEAMV